MVQNLKQLLSHDLIFIDENSNMTDNWYLIYKKDLKWVGFYFCFRQYYE